MLCELGVEIGSEAIAVAFGEGHRGCDIEVMEEVGDVEED